TSGFYVGGGGGVNWTEDSDFTANDPSVPFNATGELQFDTGWAAVGQVGYKGLGLPGLRLEFEFNYRDNDLDRAVVDSLNGTSISATELGALVGTGPATGSVRSIAPMFNVLYDFNTGSPVTPYIGGGVGPAWVKLKLSEISSGASSDTDLVFAYQGIAGLAYNITNNLSVWLDYRYFATQDPEWSLSGTTVDGEYSNHTVMLGLRYFFGQPPAPPPPTPAAAPAPAPAAAPAPAPAPGPQRNFLVFFDWDRADITAEGQRVIEQAAASAKAGNVTRITATGHADRSGSDRYNQRLSERRGNNVKAGLVRQGIPENQIVVVGKGEAQPLVPTADGVREPQNRRVEIVLQ
ncbi:MAG TPA: OmpA family protein, partial [Alphaproteobacteria bacterium]|nr:OmpA family protein [Alphaproteobacteria bacterium]